MSPREELPPGAPPCLGPQQQPPRPRVPGQPEGSGGKRLARWDSIAIKRAREPARRPGARPTQSPTQSPEAQEGPTGPAWSPSLVGPVPCRPPKETGFRALALVEPFATHIIRSGMAGFGMRSEAQGWSRAALDLFFVPPPGGGVVFLTGKPRTQKPRKVKNNTPLYLYEFTAIKNRDFLEIASIAKSSS